MSASTSAATFQSLQPGTSFGAYDVLRCIGIGGMGAVFEARHRLLDRLVALKVMHGESRDGFDLRARFLREGAALVRVKHPNVVTVYDAGIVDGMPFLAMELLDGISLDRLFEREGPLAAERAVALLAPIADGLAAVHDAGLVHRDVKPENLFLTTDGAGRDVVKLIDFGIAKETANTGARNTVVGTPHYMPPEQLFGGEPLDGRADQYALAVVLYEALTNTLPYDGTSVLELAMKVEEGGAPPPSLRAGAGIPSALDTVVLRALARHARDRFPTMDELYQALLDAVPFGLGTRRSSSMSMSAELDVSAELLRTRDLPTMVEPLGATQAVPRTVDPLPAPAAQTGPQSTRPKVRSRVPVYAVLGASFVLALVAGLLLARGTRSEASVRGTTVDQAPAAAAPVVGAGATSESAAETGAALQANPAPPSSSGSSVSGAPSQETAGSEAARETSPAADTADETSAMRRAVACTSHG